MDIKKKKFEAILNAFLTIKFPGAGAGEEIEEWKDAVLDWIDEEFKEINAQEEEKKAAARKECDKTKKK